MGESRRPCLNTFENSRQHPVQIFSHICIGEPEHFETPSCQHPVAMFVDFGLMRITVNLHDQPFGGAEEIADVTFDDGLTAKLESAELRRSQFFPNRVLAWRWLTPHGTREITKPWVDS